MHRFPLLLYCTRHHPHGPATQNGEKDVLLPLSKEVPESGMQKRWILVPLPPLPLPLPQNVVILLVAIPLTNAEAAGLADRFRFRFRFRILGYHKSVRK